MVSLLLCAGVGWAGFKPALGVVPEEGTGATPGGGGNGAIPAAFLSLAAAAAAAEAYFNVSPGGLVGKGAGFIELFVAPFVTFPSGVCSVANAGRGDLSWFDGLLAAAACGSETDDDFGFPPPAFGPLPSAVSGKSSCID